MAIEKIPFPASVPAAVSDYQKQNALLMALVKSVDGAQKVVGGNVVHGAVFNVGGTLYVATSDTAISGVASDYVKLTPSVDTLTLVPSYVASLAGVSWNAEYKGYYDGSGNLYEFDEAKAIYDGALSVGFINKPNVVDGDLEGTVFGIDFERGNAGTYGEHIIAPSSVWIIPTGIYMLAINYGVKLEIYSGSSWISQNNTYGGGLVLSDGVNFRLNNYIDYSNKVVFRKLA
ncbi:MAG: hypothetical protein PHS14_07955 [Elusimicrobia bacterium]|nr:hypothetical protein [Elusimicrobiota bacterium]